MIEGLSAAGIGRGTESRTVEARRPLSLRIWGRARGASRRLEEARELALLETQRHHPPKVVDRRDSRRGHDEVPVDEPVRADCDRVRMLGRRSEEQRFDVTNEGAARV